jgi:hypothetical protein
LLIADYSFFELLWWMIVFFAWVIWFWLLITVFADLFRRKDASGGKKVLWIVFLILAPFVGVLAYLIANNDGMTERNLASARAQQEKFDDYVKTVASSEGGAAAEIEKAKALLDSGAISQAEFESLKQKALSA